METPEEPSEDSKSKQGFFSIGPRQIVTIIIFGCVAYFLYVVMSWLSQWGDPTN